MLPPARLLALSKLARRLGPWAKTEGLSGVARTRWVLREEPTRLEAYVYDPATFRLGSYLIAPGLHFLGPDDPRLDRFCRVLADAGFRVVAPFLPAYLKLLVLPSAADDLEIVARALLERMTPGERPTLFSISFGSGPAFEVAARLGDSIDAVVAFGGYAEFESAVRFCIDGVMRRGETVLRLPRDPLNAPALFLNLLPFCDRAATDTSELECAWREVARRTWGRLELKEPGRLEPIAREIAQGLSENDRELFLIGCGVAPGALGLIDAALPRARERLAFADPRQALERLLCPVVVCHGRDDDVIPWGEAEKLCALLEARVPVRLLLTGLFGHTGAGRARLRDAVGEGRTLLEIASVLASGGAVRSRFR